MNKRIPDILLAITHIDEMYDSIKKDKIKFKKKSRDKNKKLTENNKQQIKDKFNENIKETENRLISDITLNETLRNYNINPENIHIQFCSSKEIINNDLEMNTINNMKQYINDI